MSDEQWAEYWDEENECAYYYNETTGETTYEDPRAAAGDGAQGYSSDIYGGETYGEGDESGWENNGEGEGWGDESGNWGDEWDENYQTWDESGEGWYEADTNNVEGYQSEAYGDGYGYEKGGEADADGWTGPHYDEESGANYWYNEVSGETQWE